MNIKEEKEVYDIDNKKYTVITRTIDDAQSLDKLYEAFSKYALKKLSLNNI